MSSINQLVSELAHSIQQADSVPVRRALRLGIIHARNELIRKSYNNHSISDKGLQQRVRLELIEVPDGDINVGEVNSENVNKIKRTKQLVPRPTRLNNNLPFHSIRTVGVEHPMEVAYVKEASSKYYKRLPGFNPTISYDYINGYIYINNLNETMFNVLDYIVVESIFENPQEIVVETEDGTINYDDDNSFFISEDLVGALKQLVLSTFNPEIVRDTNTIPNTNLVK